MSEYLRCRNCGKEIELSDEAFGMIVDLVNEMGTEKGPTEIIEEVVREVFTPCCENPNYSFVCGDYCKVGKKEIFMYFSIPSEYKRRKVFTKEASEENEF